MNLEKINYDGELAQFGPTGNTFPYLKLLLLDGAYHLFEGAIGPDRYQYFAVPQHSAAGQACEAFIDKYYRQNTHRIEYYEEGITLQETCKANATEALSDRPAYMKYWNLALTGNDKKRLTFYVIPFFEALVEWYTIQVASKVSELSTNLKSQAAIAAHKTKWQRDLHGEVASYIENNKLKEGRRWSSFSIEHGRELLRFRDWLNALRQPTPNAFSFPDFIADFAEREAHIDCAVNSETGQTSVFYSVNGKQYPVEIFWIFFKNYHVEQAAELNGYQEQLNYFRRIVPQMQILKQQNYEKLRTDHQLPAEIASVVKTAAEDAIRNVEDRIRDIERYFSEQATKQEQVIPRPSTLNLQDRIIETIGLAGIGIQQTPSQHQDKSEEGIRDAFLPYLYSLKDKSVVASAETFNKEGKTDISIKSVNGITVFVAECKVWTGKANYHAGITQLIDRYIDWTQERGALLLFVRKAEFTNILKTIRVESQTHPYFVKVAEDHSSAHLSLWYRQRDDKKRHVRIDIMAFHFFPPVKKGLPG